MMDVGRALKNAIETGQVWLGVERARKAVKQKKAKLLVLASNCPDAFLKEQKEVKVYFFGGSNVELGSTFGKPFSISAAAIIDPGESDILSV